MNDEITLAALLTTAVLTGLLHTVAEPEANEKGEVRNLPVFEEANQAGRSC